MNSLSLNRKDIELGIQDLITSCKLHRIWLYLGWTNIKHRYRGSVLGPLWITLSMIVFIAALGVVYSRLFSMETEKYIPFLTAGILVWTYISAILTESCNVFVDAQTYIYNIKLPYILHMLERVWRNIIIFLHNLVVFLFVAIYFHVPITKATLLVIPGFILVTLTITSCGLLLGMIGTRYRDIPPVVTSMITVVFFVSPISWTPELIGSDSLVLRLNPVCYFLDLVRSPLLGHVPHLSSWLVCAGLTVFSFTFAMYIFCLGRRKILFWI